VSDIPTANATKIEDVILPQKDTMVRALVDLSSF